MLFDLATGDTHVLDTIATVLVDAYQGGLPDSFALLATVRVQCPELSTTEIEARITFAREQLNESGLVEMLVP